PRSAPRGDLTEDVTFVDVEDETNGIERLKNGHMIRAAHQSAVAAATVNLNIAISDETPARFGNDERQKGRVRLQMKGGVAALDQGRPAKVDRGARERERSPLLQRLKFEDLMRSLGIEKMDELVDIVGREGLRPPLRGRAVQEGRLHATGLSAFRNHRATRRIHVPFCRRHIGSTSLAEKR